MAKNRKYFPNKSVLFISSRTEEGLPMPPTLVMNMIIWGILADARSRYQIKICHFLFMSNHLHMLVVVENPEHVPAFMRYVKSEIAHAINRLLGRQKRTIWAEGYDSPVLLTPEQVIRYIKYTYLNPVKEDLVDSIDDYPGVSSWRMFRTGHHSVRHARVPRPALFRLSSPALGVNEQKRIVELWKRLETEKHEFVLEPWAWLECFPGVKQQEAEEHIFSSIREEEQQLREQRKRDGRKVLGPTALRRQSMLKEHTPKKRARRMVAISEDKELRKRFIKHFRHLCALARDVYERWKIGDFSAKIPPGLFAPRVPTLASALRI